MTLDEAIFEFKERAEDSRKISELGIKSYIPKEKEEEQLAEWLEELKRYKEEPDGYLWDQAANQGYLKAVDDFAIKLKSRLTDAIYQKDVDGMENLIDEIAKQLKCGGVRG